MTYENIYTHKRVTIVRVENVPNNPEPIRVYVLSDGSRWEVTQFHACFVEVEP